MTDWKEYPECPHCGAIQALTVATKSEQWRWTCCCCRKQFTLDIQVTRRYRSEKEED